MASPRFSAPGTGARARDQQVVQVDDLEVFTTKLCQGKSLPKIVLTQATPQPEDPYQLTSFLMQKLYGRDIRDVNAILRCLPVCTPMITLILPYTDLYSLSPALLRPLISPRSPVTVTRR
jgi:hypothetical protein